MTYRGAWARIERTENGWIVRGTDDTRKGSWVFEDEPEEPATNVGPGYARSLVSALWQVAECLNAGGSRYDPERINITTRRGDKAVT